MVSLQTNSYVQCRIDKLFPAQPEMSLKDSLERALDGRGCNFKVLISSGVHALVGSDA